MGPSAPADETIVPRPWWVSTWPMAARTVHDRPGQVAGGGLVERAERRRQVVRLHVAGGLRAGLGGGGTGGRERGCGVLQCLQVLGPLRRLVEESLLGSQGVLQHEQPLVDGVRVVEAAADLPVAGVERGLCHRRDPAGAGGGVGVGGDDAGEVVQLLEIRRPTGLQRGRVHGQRSARLVERDEVPVALVGKIFGSLLEHLVHRGGGHVRRHGLPDRRQGRVVRRKRGVDLGLELADLGRQRLSLRVRLVDRVGVCRGAEDDREHHRAGDRDERPSVPTARPLRLHLRYLDRCAARLD